MHIYIKEKRCVEILFSIVELDQWYKYKPPLVQL